jgi:hypothetical protein
MACIGLHEAWVVADRSSYLNTCLTGDELFTSEAEAQAELVKANEAFMRMPLRTTDKSGYAVMTLVDFMTAQRDEAVEAQRIGADRL